MRKLLNGFYKGKNVLITGHTGFKGSWLSIWLHELGANVIGYALAPLHKNDIYNLSDMDKKVTSINGDVRSVSHLKEVFNKYKPEIVFHLAAQPIVLQSYDQPYYTYEVNVMGTMNVLERIKETPETKSAIIITSDKCYKNKEWIYGYRENDEMGGDDLYSSSKGCAELLVASYRDSFFSKVKDHNHRKVLASVRAGNVIGGGDWSPDRIVPDCIRALEEGTAVTIRNPNAIRPWQHVLEPLYGYLLLASKCFEENAEIYSDAWNFGPDFGSVLTVEALVERIINIWNNKYVIINKNNKNKKYSNGSNENYFLNIDSTKSKYYLKWQPVWDIDRTIDKTIEWYKQYKNTDAYGLCAGQIKAYCKDMVKRL